MKSQIQFLSPSCGKSLSQHCCSQWILLVVFVFVLLCSVLFLYLHIFLTPFLQLQSLFHTLIPIEISVLFPFLSQPKTHQVALCKTGFLFLILPFIPSLTNCVPNCYHLYFTETRTAVWFTGRIMETSAIILRRFWGNSDFYTSPIPFLFCLPHFPSSECLDVSFFVGVLCVGFLHCRFTGTEVLSQCVLKHHLPPNCCCFCHCCSHKWSLYCIPPCAENKLPLCVFQLQFLLLPDAFIPCALIQHVTLFAALMAISSTKSFMSFLYGLKEFLI